MEHLLTQVTQQAMNYAIRSGIAITGGYALSQCSRFLKTRNGSETQELERLQRLLEGKIRIISPAIDMIELIAARGNSSLESAVALTKSLRWDIQSLGVRLSEAAEAEDQAHKRSSRAKSQTQREADLIQVTKDLKDLLQKIEDSVPLINLAITTSGVSLSSNLPISVSPSRLLQASVFLSGGDAQYHREPSLPTQIGPFFSMSMYMLFSGHSAKAQNEQHFRNTIWKEVFHKAQLRLVRTPLSRLYDFPGSSCGNAGKIESTSFLPGEATAEFAYQLLIVEDLDDGRLHSSDDSGSPNNDSFDGVSNAGVRLIFPIHEVSKIFYADTGKVLNLGNDDETNNPVLLLKRDPNANFPRRMMRAESEAPALDDVIEEADGPETLEVASQIPCCNEKNRLPPGLDPEWYAFEVYSGESDSDNESTAELEANENPDIKQAQQSQNSPVEPDFISSLSHLEIDSTSPLRASSDSNVATSSPGARRYCLAASPNPSFSLPVNIRTSLSLFEMLIRLASLQQFQQASHLTINDELLNFFLEDASTTGAASGDSESRKRIRMEARRRVGFDPYDESPIKRRGEQYQYSQHDTVSDRGQSNCFASTPDSRRSHGSDG